MLVTDQQTPQDDQPSIRGSVELPRVVLGSQEFARDTPKERVLPGRVNIRWALYPAYSCCFLAGALALNFALQAGEWAAAPVALAWGALYFWVWIYAVSYSYRRPILKYSSLAVLTLFAALLAWACLDRGAAGSVIAHGQLIERGSIPSLKVAALLTLSCGALAAIHAFVLGRGYRRVKSRAKTAE